MYISTKVFTFVSINQHNIANIAKMGKVSNSLKSRVEALAKGEALEVSLDQYKYDTLRVYATRMGLELKRRYVTTLTRATRTCKITRYE